jgi:hypothetical protein
MKLAIIAIAVAGLSYCSKTHADCYIRSDIALNQTVVNSPITDVQKIVTPDDRGQKCVLRYRVHVGDDWQTAEGQGYGATEEKACAQAEDIKRGHILEEVTPSKIGSDTQMVCGDLLDIRVHPVRIGDIVWESETDLHTYPQERKYFWYKRTQCRMFVERNARNQNLILYQGVVCRLNATGNSKWQVIDKY